MFGFGKKKKKTVTIITVKSDDMDLTQFEALREELKKALVSKEPRLGVFLVRSDESIEVSQIQEGE